MGQSQFMPSSFLNFAVSFRGDGPPDIWTRREDVFASIANYLARSGWRGGEGWGEQVVVAAGSRLAAGRTPEAGGMGGARRHASWRERAARPGPATPRWSLPAAPDGPHSWSFDNFRVILKWNNSNYFAIAVGLLADSIERR